MMNKAVKDVVVSSMLVAFCCVFTALGRTPSLGETKWQLTYLNGKAVSTKAYLEFDARLTRVTGNAGCNRMFGSVVTINRQISFGPLGMTKMACAEREANRIESEFTTALARVNRLRQSGESLQLMSGSRIILRFTAKNDEPGLEDKKWIVENLNGKKIEVKGEMPFISFDAEKQSAGGNTACNVFGGSYAVSGDTIRIFDTISTMRACIEDDRMEIERKFMDALQSANRFEIKNGKLYLYRKSNLLMKMRGENK
ncbi:MAG: META domain-containing protein [Pyrinomonadaceae bacterium]